MMDRLPKKFAQPIHPSTATALPPPICSERKYVTSKPEPEPENSGLQKEPGFGNSSLNWAAVID